MRSRTRREQQQEQERGRRSGDQGQRLDKGFRGMKGKERVEEGGGEGVGEGVIFWEPAESNFG